MIMLNLKWILKTFPIASVYNNSVFAGIMYVIVCSTDMDVVRSIPNCMYSCINTRLMDLLNIFLELISMRIMG